MKTSDLRRKRGSYILEAAFIYPVSVLISAMLILLMLFLFSSIQDAAGMSGAVRREAGTAAGTVEYGTPSGEVYEILEWRSGIVKEPEISEHRAGVLRSFCAETQRRGMFLALFPTDVHSETRSEWSCLDEDELVRNVDLISEKIGLG